MTAAGTSTRFHSSGDMDGLPELAGITEPVAVVIRPGGSLDVYGQIGIIDQRPETAGPDGILTFCREQARACEYR